MEQGIHATTAIIDLLISLPGDSLQVLEALEVWLSLLSLRLLVGSAITRQSGAISCNHRPAAYSPVHPCTLQMPLPKLNCP